MESRQRIMRNWINGAMATCGFELKRSFTFQRTAVSIVLALFPPLMVGLMIGATQVANAAIQTDQEIQERAVHHAIETIQIVQGFAPFAIVFLVSLVCLLSLLLWATPNVYSELEGKSWAFIASRPGGRVSIYLGKFLLSVIVSFAISLVALSLSVLVAHQLLTLPDPQRLWLSLTGIYLLACLVYGAIFSMLGTLFYKRAMVVAAGYLIGSEVFLATIPAVIGKLTMRFHLQELGIRWIGFFLPFDSEREYALLYGPQWPTWANLLVLIGTGCATLLIGGLVIVNRQYITSDES
jgi:ABC-type transport system involved in multi-copper enzyme maturation permease subunit